MLFVGLIIPVVMSFIYRDVLSLYIYVYADHIYVHLHSFLHFCIPKYSEITAPILFYQYDIFIGNVGISL